MCAPAGNTDPEPAVVSTGQRWRAEHVRESQYFFQIIRCNDLECCSAWSSSLQHLGVLPDRFLPNLAPVKHSGQNVIIDVQLPNCLASLYKSATQQGLPRKQDPWGTLSYPHMI